MLSETYIDRQFNDVYVGWADLDLAGLEFDRSEVAELRFVAFERFRRMAAAGSAGLAPVYAGTSAVTWRTSSATCMHADRPAVRGRSLSVTRVSTELNVHVT